MESIKKGSRFKTPHGKGTFIEFGKGKCIKLDVTGMLLIQLDNMWNGHFNWYYHLDELKKI